MKAARQHTTESSPTISSPTSYNASLSRKNEESFLSVHRNQPFIQTKLSVGNVEDKYEREADNAAGHIAQNVMNGSISQQPLVSRIDEKHKVQQKTEGSINGLLPSVVFEEKLIAGQNTGEALPENLKELMQKSFGHNLSKVRIHSDAYANDLNNELDNRSIAFAYNEHIYFKNDKYRPDELGGIVLLAHEITHVIQQGKTEILEEPKHDLLVPTNEAALKPILKEGKQKKQTPKSKKSGKKHHAKSENEKKFEQQPDASAIAELEKGAKKTSPRSPEEDPNFITVVGKAKKQAKKTKKHDPAEKKQIEMQNSVKLPTNEVDSLAKSKQVEKLSEQKPAKFDAVAFKEALMKKIVGAAPKNLEQAVEFKTNNQLEEVKSAVSGKVGEEKEKAAQDIQETNTETPSTEGISARDAKPLPPSGIGTTNTNIGAKKASPPPRLAEEISLKAGSDSLDTEMKDGDVSEAQIKESKEPTFNTALSSKNEAQQDAKTAPILYQKDEKTIVSKAETDANKVATGDLMEMHGVRSNEFNGVEQKQETAKTEEEKIREEIAKGLETIYNESEKLVEDRLTKLTTDVTTQFETGAKAAKLRFETEADAKMTAYKRRRYSGFWGPAKWLKDKFCDLPSEVNKFYEDGRANYLADMDIVITNISTHVADQLNAATQDIATGRKKVQDYFNNLDENKKRIGQSTFDETMGKFGDLESKVEDSQGELIDSLAEKYKENLKQIDERIEAMKEANKGLVSKAIGAIKGVIKAILELKDMLLKVLAKVVKAIGYIIKHPIAFLGNLISAVGRGLRNFGKNILEHLQTGFLKWLTGAAGDIKIEIPEKLDTWGIFKMVFSVLGLTVENFMDRVAKKIPAPILENLKKAQGVISIVLEKGIGGLWEHIKGQVESLLTGAKDAVFDFLQNKIMQAGIDFILKMLTPAGAFIKACQAIYKIIMFIWENAKRIIQFIDGVLDSILDIASGNLDAAAKKVENSLANIIPLAIGFLAALLNLDSIPKKVIEIIKRLKDRIDAIIDSIIMKAWDFGKKLVGKAVAGGKAVVGAVMGFFGIKTHFTTEEGEQHDIYFEDKNNKPKLVIASTPQDINKFIENFEKDYSPLTDNQSTSIKEIKSFLKNNEQEYAKLSIVEYKNDPEKETQRLKIVHQSLLKKNVALSELLKKMLSKNKKIGNDISSYALEGLTGTYNSMPKPPSDILTPDHQPQASVLIVASNLIHDKKLLFKAGGELKRRASGNHANGGYAINLHEIRHKAGRTYGRSPKEFISESEKVMDEKIDVTLKRKKIIELMKTELKQDVKVVLDIIKLDKNWSDIKGIKEVDLKSKEKDTLIDKIKTRIQQGERELLNQPMDSLNE